MQTRLALSALLLAACAHNAASVVPAGEQPQWAALKEDSRYPKSRFVVGVGMLPVPAEVPASFVEQLDAAARKELAKTLQVDVSAQVKSLAASLSVGGVEQSVQSVEASAVEAVNLELSGVEIAQRWRDDKARVVYALAVLDKSAAAPRVRAQLQARRQSADDFLARGDQAAGGGDVAGALRAYLRARGEMQGAAASAVLLRALTGENVDAPPVAQAEQKLGAVVDGIALTAVEGDGARALPGKPLARPLVVQAVFGRAGEAKPLPGVPVAFALPGGRIDARVATGPDGRASANVLDAGAMQAEAKAVASLDWSELAANAGMDLAKGAPAWMRGLRQVEAGFRIVPRSLATTRVVVKVLEKVEEGAPVTESVVESQLVKDLAGLGFDVKDSKELVDALGGLDKLAAATDAEIKAKARGIADVIVIGNATSRFHKKFAGAMIYHRARGVLRAVDVGDGKVLQNVDLDLPCDNFGQGPDKAGALALKTLAGKVSSQLAKGLKENMGY